MIITKYLSEQGINYSIGVDTAKISSIKAGGVVKCVIYPKTINEFIESMKIIKAVEAKYKVIGSCTNTFFDDRGYDGVIISTKQLSSFRICGDYTVDVNCGTLLSSLIRYAANFDFELSSSLFGIPGTLGGAIRNNAGAFGASISDIFVHGVFLDVSTLELITLFTNELEFSYRYSVLQKENLVFLYGKLKGRCKNKALIFDEITSARSRRIKSQPSLPSLGSFFKRNGNLYPSKLIDEAGLKGLSVGGAAVSEKHAGFIVNTGGATAKDIDTLAKYVEKSVIKRYGITLNREAEYIS